jgi:hypothetical protein
MMCSIWQIIIVCNEDKKSPPGREGKEFNNLRKVIHETAISGKDDMTKS